MKVSSHYRLLLVAIALGTVLRFCNLAAKPIWMDEVITALFSLGQTYLDVPLNQALPVSAFEQIFRLQPMTCSQIVETVSTQSVHPPLFFCWMHSWLSWLSPLPLSWVWKIRTLPAIFGILAIAGLYQLNRGLFSARAGLLGAAVMAVSPFAVYLSQEARHYTLPMVLTILALLGLYQVLQDLLRKQLRPAIWLGWMAVNSLGFYVHYFFLLVLVAEIATLAACLWVRRPSIETGNGDRPVRPTELFLSPSVSANGSDAPTHNGQVNRNQSPAPIGATSDGEQESQRQSSKKAQLSAWLRQRPWLVMLLAVIGIGLTYLPWATTFLSHLNRPETNWMTPFSRQWHHAIAPIWQILSAWILMVIALPVERQPLWVQIPSVTVMLAFSGWLAWQLWIGLKGLWKNPQTRLPTQVLLGFILAVLAQMLAIVYLLDKDITQVPRYNFIYFPAVCALLGASLNHLLITPAQTQSHRCRWVPDQITQPRGRLTVLAVLVAGVISSSLVVANLAFLKPYYPDQIAQNLRFEPDRPLLVGSGYADWQDVALGLSFALELAHQQAQQAGMPQPYFALLARSPSYESVWHRLAHLQHPLPAPLNLWIIGAGLRRKEFPQGLDLGSAFGAQSRCLIDPNHYHRVGIPFQLYRCR